MKTKIPFIKLNSPLPPPFPTNVWDIVAFSEGLTTKMLKDAYQHGIFPWPDSQDEKIIPWCSPDPRCILAPNEIKISRSMKKVIRDKKYQISGDHCFKEVMKQCATNHGPTWISNSIIEQYCNLHEEGYAHSIEVWNDKAELSGGLYGIVIGSCFFGESMFKIEPNTSKLAFISLAKSLEKLNFSMIDCQMPTNHLLSLGASSISKEKYLEKLNNYTKKKSSLKNWNNDIVYPEL